MYFVGVGIGPGPLPRFQMVWMVPAFVPYNLESPVLICVLYLYEWFKCSPSSPSARPAPSQGPRKPVDGTPLSHPTLSTPDTALMQVPDPPSANWRLAGFFSKHFRFGGFRASLSVPDQVGLINRSKRVPQVPPVPEVHHLPPSPSSQG